MRPPGVYYGVSREEYDHDPGINQSVLKDFINASTPARFKEESARPKEVTPAMRLGSAVDCAASDYSEFKTKYVITPATYPCEPTKSDPRTEKPWTFQANYCKDWKSKMESGGKIVLTQDEANTIDGVLLSLSNHNDAFSLLKGCKKQVMVVANHPTYQCRMKCLIDLMPEEPEWLFDLKVTESADPITFTKKCAVFGYHIQAAYYMDVCRFAGLNTVNHFGFIAVDSTPPHGVMIHYLKLDDPETERGRLLYNKAIVDYGKCVADNEWPSYTKAWTHVTFDQWMLKDRFNERDVLQ